MAHTQRWPRWTLEVAPALILGLLLQAPSSALAQESRPALQDRKPGASAAEVQAAREAFELVAKNLEGVVELHADYVQSQESLLLAEPLESKGRFHLRLQPGCMVLDIAEPSPLRIRSDERTHRIHYPAQARAEVFLFETNRLTAALIACFRADLTLVEEVFTIQSYAESEVPREDQEPLRLATVTLAPRAAELKQAMRSLTVVFDLTRRVPASVAQVNSEGETVSFRLVDVRQRKQPSEDAAQIFDRALPEGTKVVETRVPAK